MATQYAISGTPTAPARTMNNRKAAITEADARARFDKYRHEVTVTTVSTGKVVHTVAARNAVLAQRTRAAAPARAAKATGRQQRTALDLAAQPGWDLLYDKPRAGYQVWRSHTPGGGYALWCPTHRHLHTVRTLAEERAERKLGGWCTGCGRG